MNGWTARIPGTRAWRSRRERELCVQTYRRLQEIVDGEVGGDPDCDRLIEHLERCVGCGAEAEEIAELKRSVERICCSQGDDLAQRLEPVVRRLLEAEDDRR